MSTKNISKEPNELLEENTEEGTKIVIVSSDCSALTLRLLKSDESKILAFAMPGEEVEVIEDGEEWSKTKYKDISGYMKTGYLVEKK